MKWVPDVIGLGAFVALCSGVYLVAGLGWSLIVFGLPTTALYLWRETSVARRPRRS